MSVPHFQTFIEQQIVERRRLLALPQRQVQTYFTGRFTQRHIPQNTPTNDSSGNFYAEIATTTREWIPILTTALGHNGMGMPDVPTDLLGRHDESGEPDISVQSLGQHDESGAPDVSAEVLGQHDEHGIPNVPTEMLGQRDESGTSDVPTELLINGVVYHRSSCDGSGEEPR